MTTQEILKLMAVVEAATITGPARNLLDFHASADGSNHSEDEATQLDLTLATYQRSRTPVDFGATPNEFVSQARSRGIAVDVIGERFLFDLRVLDGLRKAAARRAPHIIETHHVKSHFLLRLSGLWRRYPWVAFHHGYTSTDAKVRLYNHLDRWSLRATHGVITVNQTFARDLSAIGVPPQRIRVLHNAIAPGWFNGIGDETVAQLRSTLQLNPQERVVLAVGRLSHEKAHNDLITAFAQLHRKNLNTPTKLLIVGDGPERPALEQLAALRGVQKDVIFTGQVSDPRPFYKVADVVALPSLSEGSPLALLEAMAATLPIVATKVGGIPEMVEHEKSALLVPPRQPEALADALARILTNGNLARKLGEQALLATQNGFTPEAHRRARMTIYHEILPRASRAISN